MEVKKSSKRLGKECAYIEGINGEHFGFIFPSKLTLNEA